MASAGIAALAPTADRDGKVFDVRITDISPPDPTEGKEKRPRGLIRKALEILVGLIGIFPPAS